MRHRTISGTFGFLAVTAVSACSSSKDEPRLDAPQALLGHWEEHGVDGVVVAEQEYAKDGSVHIINNIGGVRDAVWAYSMDEDTLALEYSGPGDPATESSTYVLSAEDYMQWAFLPEGPVDGPIGTWRSMLRTSSGPWGGSSGGVDSYEERLTVNADGTATFIQTHAPKTPEASSFSLFGQWSVKDNYFTIESDGEHPAGLSNPTVELRYAPGGVIGHHLFERSAP